MDEDFCDDLRIAIEATDDALMKVRDLMARAMVQDEPSACERRIAQALMNLSDAQHELNVQHRFLTG